MLGQPISMVLPEVVGYKVTGELSQLVTSTDVVLTITKVSHQRCFEVLFSKTSGFQAVTRSMLGLLDPQSQVGEGAARLRVRTPSGAQGKCEFFRVKNVVLTRRRWCAQPLCVYARTKMITYAR